MKRTVLLLTTSLLFTAIGRADWVHEYVNYNLDGTPFRGHLIYKKSVAMGRENLPCIFMVPNWMGPGTADTLEKAKKVAGDEFAVFIADMYGIDVRPTNGKEAGAAHSFTNPEADSDGSRYHALTAKRAFEMMDDFAEEVLELPN